MPLRSVYISPYFMRARLILALMIVAVVGTSLLAVQATDTIPSQFTDAEFWRMVSDFSEPDGRYEYQNFISNEISYQNVLPELKRVANPGGVYLGVGPEQNFTYVAALKPKVAFIIDIRRQNMIVHLMYKALFEIAPDRVEFVSRLFSRRKPAGLGATSSVDAILQAYESAASDRSLYMDTLQQIKDRLIKQRQFKPVGDDEQKLEYVFDVFSRGGPRLHSADQTSLSNSKEPTSGSIKPVTSALPCSRLSLASREVTAFAKCTSANVPSVRLLTRFYRAPSSGSQALPVHQQSWTKRHLKLVPL